MAKSIGSIDGAVIDQLVKKVIPFLINCIYFSDQFDTPQNADFNGRLTSPTAERLALIDFTASIAVLNFAFIQPMPKIENRFLAPLKPFQPTVLNLEK